MAGLKLASDPKAAEVGGIPMTVAETGPFIREAEKIFSSGELDELRNHAAQFRELGTVIRETGGLRKLRWCTDNNKGKSHGARIIYYYGGDHMPLYLVAVYAKSKKVTFTGPEKKAARKLVEALKREFSGAQLLELKIVQKKPRAR